MKSTQASCPLALVTGAATGIGRACAIGLAKRGFDVVVNYSRNEIGAQETAELARRENRECSVVCCDVSREEEVAAMLQAVSNDFGRLDVLINNAGTTKFLDPQDLEAMTTELWDQILGVNLKGPFYCIRAAADLLRKSDQASVVNISSVAGIRGTGSCHAYSASKGGLNALTKSLASALAPKIRINAVCPGPVDGQWMRQNMSEAELAKQAAQFPIPRPATPEDIASTAIYLALDTTYTTGELLVVDGGRSI